MRCTLLGGLCAFCLLLTISIVIILLSQSSSCPLGTFRCLGNDSEIGVCLPRRLLCDNRPDCPDGSDEDPLKCSDNYGELQSFVNVVSENPAPESTTVQATVSPFFANCSAKAYPRGCTCQNRTWLFCLNLDLMSVPTVEARLSRLVLMNNSIKRLSAKDLEGYDLEFIRLEDNLLEVIEDDALSHQRNLTKLMLGGNKLSDLSASTFQGLDRLKWLFLYRNQLGNTTNMKVFHPLTSLRWLDLSHNDLDLGSDNVFPHLDSLLDLFLNENRIQMIRNNTVASLTNLILLDLKHNSIREIHEDAFVLLSRLKFLDLSYNMLEYVPENLFRSQRNLTQLRLGFNPIHHVPAGLFLPLSNLRSLRLQDIDIPDISEEMFAPSTLLDFAYFKNFRYCSYVAHASKCQPLSDGVSSFSDLISHGVHRAFLWIIGVLTIVGNALVLGGRNLAKTENRILAMFVKNLAAADMCIGIYLLCLGERDISFRGQYNQHAHHWMMSWQCTVIRVLAVSTSEVSLLLLTFMSVERFVSISHPFGERTLNFRAAFISTALIWTVGLALSLIPVLYWSEMGRHHGSNGLCFPLHIHEPSALGWQYSAFLYIGINGSCVLVIVGVYTALFVSIRRTRTATPLAPNEIEIAVRFFFIVFTDCLCWMPTILLKIMALANVYIPADLYAWLVVFILPVNSAINPLLYTFTTPTFRAAVRDFYHRFALLRPDWTSAATSSIGLTTMGRGVRSSASFRHNDFNQSSTQGNHVPVATEEEGRHHTDLVLLDIRAETIVLQQQQQPKAKSLWRSGAKPANHFIESL
ncbi:relaxin receptor 2-like isoform X1 [Daphnia pulex]|uniref:relaxin receptor 2-like isoform X1 n=2 Tax=Daphnia pulex TaxID=6669 RepID=UPI001EE0C13C|nr:relaxin receptor 2-like isoform X1 [Daphnia pulex]XP_046456320.1 relaxin receptor 2-like isoform X1 [Daphnia pulex]XP_046456321.1 relaxin receptor 2-like isoform X1 [Daphnia pulex]XP_046456322.1 relaxin receptor 2-like isoform X1 [Daphnia pulex]XP_046456323.1 relaxin receptor 2-like isoform X1 [Daphnia pulex]XP_046456324.1 relaxin receptor 2-like isoform X1 [Daphnia pulex]XP_046456325.1 relaxin receptor 2-like isoform X1 [Daphnia pulex]XP_046456326.1 relaxin receptor 2-like isoform X1 [Da